MCLCIMFSAQHVQLGASSQEDEDVSFERRRMLSDDVDEDVLVLQDLTKVRDCLTSSSLSSVTTLDHCGQQWSNVVFSMWRPLR